MLIKQPPSSSPRSHVLNPQLHTRKNHHTYNGALHLPESTHVQVIPHHHPKDTPGTSTTPTSTATTNRKKNNPSTTTTTTTTTITKANRRRYLVTLYYAHNRACELRRSADDVLVLRQALDTVGCPVQDAAAAAAVVDTTGTGGSDSDVPAEQQIPCPGTCSCLCPCAVRGSDVRSAMEVNYMLGAALAKVGKGDIMARVAVEWFLRRRIGDCGGG